MLWNSVGDTLIKKKRHITLWGLTKFQNDYISTGETFYTKTHIPLVLDETKLVVQLLSDLSFMFYLELRLIWQLNLMLYRHLHA